MSETITPAAGFDAALALVFAHEGKFVDDPADPGGATKYGITRGTLAAWRRRPVTVAEVRALTRAEARKIYRARYWDAIKADAMPPAVALMVFDFAVNAGVSRAVETLQRITGAKVDGRVGPQTLASLEGRYIRLLLTAYAAARMAHYTALPTWHRFGTGWARRNTETLDAALALVSPAPEAPAPGRIMAALAALGRALARLLR